MRKKRNLKKHREVVSILMESTLYFDLPLKERLTLVRRLVLKMEQDTGPRGSEVAPVLVDCRTVDHRTTG